MKGISFLMVGAVLAALALAQTFEDPSQDHVDMMKAVGKYNGNIKKGIDVGANATAMADEMKKVRKFYKGKSDEATKSCKECRDGALAIAKAASASDSAGVKAGMKMVGAGCKGCHDKHRHKVAENKYQIKW